MASPEPDSGDDSKSLVAMIKELHIKPLTCSNVMYYYLPLQGTVSFSALSINVMNPNLVTRLFPKHDVANVLLCGTLVGTGLYIYDRPHMKLAPGSLRLGYSVFGAVIFSLGSVLLWAVMRSFVPKNVILCSMIGIGSGVGLIKAGMSYLSFVDSKVSVDSA